jgi:hypothetical protein
MAAMALAGWRQSSDSTSTTGMLSPPRMITSLPRPMARK